MSVPYRSAAVLPSIFFAMCLLVSGAPGAEAQTMSPGATSHTAIDHAAIARTTLPETIDRASLNDGFLSVRRSVEQCVERQLKRGGEFPVESVRVEVLIQRSGAVRRLRLNPGLRRTTFARCMKAHSGRWMFQPFTGDPLRVAKRFKVLKPKKEEDTKKAPSRRATRRR